MSQYERQQCMVISNEWQIVVQKISAIEIQRRDKLLWAG